MGESQATHDDGSINRNPQRRKNSSPISDKFQLRCDLIIFLWTLWFIYFKVINEIIPTSASVPVNPNLYAKGRLWKTTKTLGRTDTKYPSPKTSTLKENNLANIVTDFNCTPPAILDFPSDLFTQAERQDGAICIHIIASLYVFYAIALICDDYFVPSIEVICEELHIPSDVAGATFMAMASSSPELFTNVVGTFITYGDIGVGTIVGSAMFNLLALCACCGFAAKTALPLDWYSLTRDCIFYFVSVILLIIVLADRHVFWYEALTLVLAFIVYILGENLKSKKRSKFETECDDELLISTAVERCAMEAEEEEINFGVFRFPLGGKFFVWIEWLLCWPARFIFAITIPDCRKRKFRKTYPITFVMCILYIAMFSYVVSWLMTIIGHTFRIPDSVMGLTFIAAGSSIPEAASTIIVARQGLGTMDISNSIGSNTYDILICLGLPWLIRCALVADTSENYIKINSGGLEYSVIILMVSLVLLYALLACNKFCLDKKVATTALITYGLYLLFAVLFEMNVFFTVNLPTCDIPS